MDYIQEFVTLASRLSFSRASEDLFITQPSLSRHLSILENELGVKLVERNTRNVSLTQAGSELYKEFISLLDAYQTVQDHAKALSSGFRGQIRISSPYYWIGDHIEPSVFSFSQRYPDIRIQMNICGPGKGAELLEKNKTDITIGFEEEAFNNEFCTKKIAMEQLCVVMSSDHPCANKKTVSFKDFPEDRFIIFELDESHNKQRSMVQKMITDHNILPSRFIFSQNISTLGLTIRQSGGVSILMNCFGNMGRDYLVSVPLSDPGNKLPLYLMRRKDCSNLAARTFFDEAPALD